MKLTFAQEHRPMKRSLIAAMFREIEQIAQFAGLASRHQLDAGETHSRDQDYAYRLYRLSDLNNIEKLIERLKNELATDRGISEPE
jgi:hypothetical protein